MNLSDLNPNEQLVLVGLAKAIVHADQSVSAEEAAAIRSLASEVGADAWNERVAEARVLLISADDLFERARTVERVAARECIFGALRRLAESDALAETELQILQWIADVWQLGGAAANVDEDDEDDEDPGTFDDEFVLFDDDDEQAD